MALKPGKFFRRHSIDGMQRIFSFFLQFLLLTLFQDFFCCFCFFGGYVAYRTKEVNSVRSEKAVMGKPVKFQGISEELQKIIDADMDNVDARRRARDAFKDVQLSIDHCLFKVF